MVIARGCVALLLCLLPSCEAQFRQLSTNHAVSHLRLIPFKTASPIDLLAQAAELENVAYADAGEDGGETQNKQLWISRNETQSKQLWISSGGSLEKRMGCFGLCIFLITVGILAFITITAGYVWYIKHWAWQEAEEANEVMKNIKDKVCADQEDKRFMIKVHFNMLVKFIKSYFPGSKGSELQTAFSTFGETMGEAWANKISDDELCKKTPEQMTAAYIPQSKMLEEEVEEAKTEFKAAAASMVLDSVGAATGLALDDIYDSEFMAATSECIGGVAATTAEHVITHEVEAWDAVEWPIIGSKCGNVVVLKLQKVAGRKIAKVLPWVSIAFHGVQAIYKFRQAMIERSRMITVVKDVKRSVHDATADISYIQCRSKAATWTHLVEMKGIWEELRKAQMEESDEVDINELMEVAAECMRDECQQQVIDEHGRDRATAEQMCSMSLPDLLDQVLQIASLDLYASCYVKLDTEAQCVTGTVWDSYGKEDGTSFLSAIGGRERRILGGPYMPIQMNIKEGMTEPSDVHEYGDSPPWNGVQRLLISKAYAKDKPKCVKHFWLLHRKGKGDDDLHEEMTTKLGDQNFVHAAWGNHGKCDHKEFEKGQLGNCVNLVEGFEAELENAPKGNRARVGCKFSRALRGVQRYSPGEWNGQINPIYPLTRMVDGSSPIKNIQIKPPSPKRDVEYIQTFKGNHNWQEIGVNVNDGCAGTRELHISYDKAGPEVALPEAAREKLWDLVCTKEGAKEILKGSVVKMESFGYDEVKGSWWSSTEDKTYPRHLRFNNYEDFIEEYQNRCNPHNVKFGELLRKSQLRTKTCSKKQEDMTEEEREDCSTAAIAAALADASADEYDFMHDRGKYARRADMETSRGRTCTIPDKFMSLTESSGAPSRPSQEGAKSNKPGTPAIKDFMGKGVPAEGKCPGNFGNDKLEPGKYGNEWEKLGCDKPPGTCCELVGPRVCSAPKGKHSAIDLIQFECQFPCNQVKDHPEYKYNDLDPGMEFC